MLRNIESIELSDLKKIKEICLKRNPTVGDCFNFCKVWDSISVGSGTHMVFCPVHGYKIMVVL